MPNSQWLVKVAQAQTRNGRLPVLRGWWPCVADRHLVAFQGCCTSFCHTPTIPHLQPDSSIAPSNLRAKSLHPIKLDRGSSSSKHRIHVMMHRAKSCPSCQPASPDALPHSCMAATRQLGHCTLFETTTISSCCLVGRDRAEQTPRYTVRVAMGRQSCPNRTPRASANDHKRRESRPRQDFP